MNSSTRKSYFFGRNRKVARFCKSASPRFLFTINDQNFMFPVSASTENCLILGVHCFRQQEKSTLSHSCQNGLLCAVIWDRLDNEWWGWTHFKKYKSGGTFWGLYFGTVRDWKNGYGISTTTNQGHSDFSNLVIQTTRNLEISHFWDFVDSWARSSFWDQKKACKA